MRQLRRSQLISSFGIGAIVDFPNDEALMTGGLDAWPDAAGICAPEFRIEEVRLQRRLQVDHFRLPPDFRPPGAGVQQPNLRIPFVNFPRWHYCPRCGSMYELGLFGQQQRCTGPIGSYCQTTPPKWFKILLPVRFIAVCPEHAHIQEFPFMEWVHDGAAAKPGCTLSLKSGGGASLGGITINCSCDTSRTMAGAFNAEAMTKIGVRCCGHRPWLGEIHNTTQNCGKELRVVQRGASNVYFAHTASSIYLPLWVGGATRPVIDVLNDPASWQMLSKGLVNNSIDFVRCESVCDVRQIPGLNAKDLHEAAERKLAGDANWDGTDAATDGNASQTEEGFRQAEYDALRDGFDGIKTDLHATAINTADYEHPVSACFSKITLVHKLKETRAFHGFSRFLPEDARTETEMKNDLKHNPNINWLPAIVVRGEGIFFEVNSALVAKWQKNPDVASRLESLIGNYNNVRVTRNQPPRTITAKFVLLHTLAHLLITQLAYECGYGSSSLRERIYCDADLPAVPMNGFLIYTASGDSEGTMGGLVRQGQPGRIEAMFLRALRKAAWCSYDPVCMESRGQGPDSCNLAACHGCAILPETSCEEGNRLLDRTMLVGLPQKPELGLFSQYLGF